MRQAWSEGRERRREGRRESASPSAPRSWLLALRGVAILLGAATTLAAEGPSPLGLRVDSTRQGDVPVGTGRVWGIVLAWGEIEAERGKPDWRAADRLLHAVDDAGRESVPVLAPRHAASPRTDLASEYAKSRKNPSASRARDWLPPDMAAWLAFVRAAVERYGPGAKEPRLRRPVRIWQVGEEFPRGWAGSDAELVELVRRTAAMVREADPSARIVLPALPADDLALFAFSEGAIPDPECRVDAGRFVGPAMEKNLRVQAQRKRFVGLIAELGKDCDYVDVHLTMRIEYVAPCLEWLQGHLNRSGSRARIVSSRGGGPLVTAGEPFDLPALRRRLVEHAVTALLAGACEIAWDWDPPAEWSGEGVRRLALSASPEGAADWERLSTLLAGRDTAEWVGLDRGRGARFARDGSWIGVVWGDGGEATWPGRGTVRVLRSDGLEEGELASDEDGWRVPADGMPRYLIPR